MTMEEITAEHTAAVAQLTRKVEELQAAYARVLREKNEAVATKAVLSEIITEFIEKLVDK